MKKRMKKMSRKYSCFKVKKKSFFSGFFKGKKYGELSEERRLIRASRIAQSNRDKARAFWG